jgi:hypothetical protein
VDGKRNVPSASKFHCIKQIEGKDMSTEHSVQSTGREEETLLVAVSSSVSDGSVVLAAHRLAVCLTAVENLPARYRNLADQSRKTQKVKEESEVEKQFKGNVETWRQLIETMLTKIEAALAWRFINLCPQFDGPISRVTENKDFCELVDYLILRRDTEQCSSDELGGLALLLGTFQREVEKVIQVV